MISNQLKISYIVPTYNAEKTIGLTIKSILSQTIKPYEIIVVNDGSTDNTSTTIHQYPVILLNKKNEGESSALNKGINHATGNFIAIVESDVIIPENWTEMLINELGAKNVMGAGAILEVANPENLIARLTGLELEQRYDEIHEKFVPHITSANSLFKKQAFDIVGTYNENLINSTLDAELNGRLIKKGYKLALNKEIKVKHFWKETIWHYIKRQFAYAFYRSELKITNLYPTDKYIKVRTIMAALIMILTVSWTLNLILYEINFLLYPLIIVLVIFLAMQIPKTVKLYKKKKDITVFLLIALNLLQSVIAVFGYTLGIINKHTK